MIRYSAGRLILVDYEVKYFSRFLRISVLHDKNYDVKLVTVNGFR